MVVKEGKRQPSKTEVLSMRMDPKARFLLDFVARARRQSVSTVVEQAIQDAADNIHTPDGRTWQDYWHVQEGIRSLKIWSDQHLFPTYEDEFKLEFTKTHWPYFYKTSECHSYNDQYIEVLWPKIDDYLSLWSNTRSSNYFATARAMHQALNDAGVKPPDWSKGGMDEGGGGGGYREHAPAAQRAATGGAPRSGGPAWEAPKGGDLGDEIPF